MQLSNNLSEIAKVIREDWKNVAYAARPYLSAMQTLNSIDDMLYHESARSIVQRFLLNAHSWHGETAALVKSHLNNLLNQ